MSDPCTPATIAEKERKARELRTKFEAAFTDLKHVNGVLFYAYGATHTAPMDFFMVAVCESPLGGAADIIRVSTVAGKFSRVLVSECVLLIPSVFEVSDWARADYNRRYGVVFGGRA